MVRSQPYYVSFSTFLDKWVFYIMIIMRMRLLLLLIICSFNEYLAEVSVKSICDSEHFSVMFQAHSLTVTCMQLRHLLCQ